MTIKEKAVYIAEKQGWLYDYTSEVWFTEGWKDSNKTEWLHQYYFSFNGLMPIVVAINANSSYEIIICFSQLVFNDGDGYVCDYKYKTDLELIDALQNAIIKYYEDCNDKI